MATKVRTQKQLDEALGRGDAWIDLVGGGVFAVTDTDSSQVRATDSSQVRATGSSQVTAYGSSQVRAYDSSQVRAYDSSQVRATDSSQVTATGSSQVTATGSVAVTAHQEVDGAGPTVSGGVLISIRRARTGREWADFYGIPVDDNGIAVLYKAVENDWRGSTKHPDITYQPGDVPSAPDWNPGQSCGGGLHLVPRPHMGDAYLNSWPAAHYVGCPVHIDQVVLLDDKIKVQTLAGPCFEVDINGEPITAEATVA